MSRDNDTLVREFVEAFNTKDSERLADYLHPEVVFQNYGEDEVRGRSAVVQVWKGVFETFEQVKFETINQAVNGDVVIAEQVHGLAFPGGPLAPVMNMAVYEIRDGRIAAWRDYGNPSYALKLLRGA
ncbi:nuclear transport factor 2 family protein [Micromonospora krabiensis]|uniref:Limonene-1,2-epoxide hydrolase n=1 Tax=Micromonospora krabiensis TaxID=307121 RepID=A0A1C3MWT8_9ACTN|nr:nuclear transport factor 2 family protein [Micromonospora krabiensis]SBV24780.1 limonene-1,2-epoxide hydrolase [Micromonospora krabiensis]